MQDTKRILRQQDALQNFGDLCDNSCYYYKINEVTQWISCIGMERRVGIQPLYQIGESSNTNKTVTPKTYELWEGERNKYEYS